MARQPLPGVLRRLRRLLTPADDVPDRQLLERFTACHDEAAFAALVRRHGGMVLGVARRVLGDAHAAEDVFQATFLVLARTAASVHRREALGGWLYRVAYRLAWEAKRRAACRAARERRATPAPPADPAAEVSWRELQAVLDAELRRLPDKFQTPLVLCYLEGKTQDEAAAALGWSKGTLRRRLERGRELLRRRLEGRGVALSAALVTAAVAQPAAPAALVAAAVECAAGGPAPGAVAALAAGAIRAMSMTKSKALPLVLALAVLAAGAGLAARRVLAAKPGDERGDPRAERRADLPGPEKSGEQARTDAHGDPLPEGALVRMRAGRSPQAGPISSLAFSPDGKTLAAAAFRDPAIRLWEAATGKELDRLTGHQRGAPCVAFSPDGKALASGSWDGTVRLWDPAAGQELRQFRETLGWPSCIAFAPDGLALASGSDDRMIRLWGVATGKKLLDLRWEKQTVCSVAFSPDGKTLAAGSCEGAVSFWEVATGKEISQVRAHQSFATSVAFSPDGRTLASASQNDHRLIRLWDVPTGKEAGRLAGHDYGVWHVAFAPDGWTLASGGNDKTVRLWETATGKLRGTFEGHQDRVRCVAFSPDGRALASGSFDGAVLVWDVTGLVRGGRREAVNLSPEDLERLWNTLAGDDAPKAYRAVWKLAAAPGQSLPFLRERLRPASPADDPRPRRLIADLDAEEFAVREKAMAELEKLGPAAEPALLQAAKDGPSAEVRRRAQQLLEKLDDTAPSGERVRALRALEVLERVGTAEARRLLKALAGGAPEARLTREAQAALARVSGRPGPTP